MGPGGRSRWRGCSPGRPLTDRWASRTVAQLNGHDIIVVKVPGELVWHSHADTGCWVLILSQPRQLLFERAEPLLGDLPRRSFFSSSGLGGLP